MKRWIPHIHCGESSDHCVLDEEDGGREGYYFQVCWLGWMISLSVTSLRWERTTVLASHGQPHRTGPIIGGTMTTPTPEELAELAEPELAAFLIEQIDGVVRDMAGHVGDQIFDVLKRNGLLMRSEAAATVMMIEASVQMLAQAADQCSRAAEEDCSDAVIAVFIQLLRDRVESMKASRASQENGRG